MDPGSQRFHVPWFNQGKSTSSSRGFNIPPSAIQEILRPLPTMNSSFLRMTEARQAVQISSKVRPCTISVQDGIALDEKLTRPDTLKTKVGSYEPTVEGKELSNRRQDSPLKACTMTESKIEWERSKENFQVKLTQEDVEAWNSNGPETYGMTQISAQIDIPELYLVPMRDSKCSCCPSNHQVPQRAAVFAVRANTETFRKIAHVLQRNSLTAYVAKTHSKGTWVKPGTKLWKHNNMGEKIEQLVWSSGKTERKIVLMCNPCYAVLWHLKNMTDMRPLFPRQGRSFILMTTEPYYFESLTFSTQETGDKNL